MGSLEDAVAKMAKGARVSSPLHPQTDSLILFATQAGRWNLTYWKKIGDSLSPRLDATSLLQGILATTDRTHLIT